MHSLNELVFRFFNDLVITYPEASSVVVFFAEPFALTFFAIVLIFLFSHEHDGEGMDNILTILVSALLAYAFAQFFKTILPAARPFVALEGVKTLVHETPFSAFPSGHATTAAAVATAVYLYHKKLGWIFIAGAVLIGVARIMAGVHWPLDVIAGFILGGVVAWGVYYSYWRFVRKKIRSNERAE